MPKPVTHVVDYGLGNLMSVAEGLRAVGSESVITSDVREIQSADRIILPGVGAFGIAMAALATNGLASAVVDAARAGTPVFGICLGMQLLFDRSSEFGDTAGLGLIAGTVERIIEQPERGGLRATHVGWRTLDWNRGADRAPLGNVNGSDSFYFVHSYAAVPKSPNDLWASAKYGHYSVAAFVGLGNVWGSQFHPEKSGDPGLAILKAFSDA